MMLGIIIVLVVAEAGEAFVVVMEEMLVRIVIEIVTMLAVVAVEVLVASLVVMVVMLQLIRNMKVSLKQALEVLVVK